MSGFRLVAYLYRCTTCGMEYRVQAGEQTFLACNHPSALDVLDNRAASEKP